jgi:hypothetical protein
MLLTHLSFTHVTPRPNQEPLALLTLLNQLRQRRTALGLDSVKSLGTCHSQVPPDTLYLTLAALAARVKSRITFNGDPSPLLIQQQLRQTLKDHNLTSGEVYLAAQLGTKRPTLLHGRLTDNPNLYTLAAIAECLEVDLEYRLEVVSGADRLDDPT